MSAEWMLLLVIAALSGSAVVSQRAVSRWARREVGSPWLSLLFGWAHLAPAAWPLLNEVPQALRPRSTFRFVLGVLKLQAMAAVLRWAFSRRTRQLRGRATHTHGVAAKGRAEVAASLGLPAHTFFRPGRTFRVLLRHANAQAADDASLDVRGVALRLESEDGAERLDLAMNTAARAQFWDTGTLVSFLIGQAGGKRAMARWLDRSPLARAAVLESLVRAPASYAELTYFSQLTFRLADTEGGEHLCRYRLRPAVEPRGSHPLSDQDWATPWNQERAVEELRPQDYLRRELRHRLEQGAIAYRLELQLGPPVHGAEAELFSAAEPWDEARYPWRAVATLELHRALTAEETRALQFNIANTPKSLGLFKPADTSDPNAIAWLRAVVYPTAQRTREQRAQPCTPQEEGMSAATSA